MERDFSYDRIRAVIDINAVRHNYEVIRKTFEILVKLVLSINMEFKFFSLANIIPSFVINNGDNIYKHFDFYIYLFSPILYPGAHNSHSIAPSFSTTNKQLAIFLSNSAQTLSLFK